MRDLSVVEAQLTHVRFRPRIVLRTDRIGEQELSLPFRGVHLKGKGGSRPNQDAFCPSLGNYERTFRDAEAAGATIGWRRGS